MPSPSIRRLVVRPRSGISVVEVLVALMLVTVGLMAIAGSSAIALRNTLDSARRREAQERAATRIASMAAAGCTFATAGTSADSTRQVHEQWWVVARINGFATVTDSVSWMTAHGPRAFALTSAIPC